jgi:hypothetical protein
MKLCKDCQHYRGQCLKHSYRQTAPSTGVTKLYGAIDALIERKSYNAYRCGHEARYWEPIAAEGEA